MLLMLRLGRVLRWWLGQGLLAHEGCCRGHTRQLCRPRLLHAQQSMARGSCLLVASALPLLPGAEPFVCSCADIVLIQRSCVGECCVVNV